MTTTIIEGFVYITNSAFTSADVITANDGTSCVKIHGTASVTHDFNNDMFYLAIPNLTSTPNPKVNNMSKIKELISVMGVLKTSDTFDGSETRTAIQKKADLRILARGIQPVTIVWAVSANSNQQKHTDFNITKVNFKELAGDVDESTSREKITVIVSGLLATSLTS